MTAHDDAEAAHGGTRSATEAQAERPRQLAVSRLDDLLRALRVRGYRLVGPTKRDGAIVYDDIESAGDLPAGWTDEQSPGTYRLAPRDDGALFGYAVGPHSYKKYFHVPTERLWRAHRHADGGFRIEPEPVEAPKIALIGARSCELGALAIQDRVLMRGAFRDPRYAARRSDVLIVAVQCGEPGGTCFCASMGTGPRADRGFDLALTELVEPAHRFVVEVGSPAGAELVRELDLPDATEGDLDASRAVTERATRHMGRTLDTTGIQRLLQDNAEHPRWDEVADRCLACTNCTLVCPTCFCSTVEDVSDLQGQTADRIRRLDSCFTMDFSHVPGGSVRSSHKARYRQWLTHKLSTWYDQFGTSGCVGCGRCITWCPVGIDITEEVAAIAATRQDTGGPHEG